MTTNTIDRQLVWVVLAIIAALIIVPLFGMMWAGPMMGGMWGTGMGCRWHVWMDAHHWRGDATPLRRRHCRGRLPRLSSDTQGDDSSDPAVKELRAAYARGDLSDEEYERRRDRLETEP